MPEENIVKKIVDQFNNLVIPVCKESIRILPDSLTLGTAILAGLSLSKSYGVLLLTMLELMIVQRGFANVISSIAPIAGGSGALNPVCEPGFQYPNMMRISLLETIGTPSMFPSPTVFFFSGVVSYLIGAMQQFGKEIKSFNSDIGVRTNIAICLSFIFILVLVLFRFTYQCEGIGSILVSLVLGYIVGLAIVFQNVALFDRDGINVLNLPMIQSVKGKPMYVCAAAN